MAASLLNAALLLEHHVTPTFVLDRNGKVAVWNRACELLTGVTSADVVGTSEHWSGFYPQARPCLADLILQDRVEEIGEFYAAFSDVQVSHGAIAAEHWCRMPRGGQRLYLAVEAVAIRDVDGELIGVLETLRDLSAMKEAETKFKSLAGLDALTGIANRRAFDNLLASEWRRAMRSDASISLLLVDIDHFKQFNDCNGHQSGDACLRMVAEALSGAVHRAGDIAARYGGEEFAIILPNTDEAGAACIAETIRVAIESRGIRHPLSSVGPVVTVSIGASTVEPTADDRVEKLICFADIALYRAKERGRNRVCAFFDEPSCKIASGEPTAGVEIPVIGSCDCVSCRSHAPKQRMPEFAKTDEKDKQYTHLTLGTQDFGNQIVANSSVAPDCKSEDKLERRSAQSWT